jgi:hypothetical protein
MKVGTWQHRIEPVEFDPSGHGTVRDKFKLNDMNVGESLFHAGIPNCKISAYTAYLHKTTRRRYMTLKHTKDGIPGTLVVRLTNRGDKE